MTRLEVEKKVLHRNDMVARSNRERFDALGAYVINIISGPGSGKTTLLEKTIGSLEKAISLAVIEGDVETDNDAARLRALGIPVEAVITGGACHLDATMVGRAFEKLKPRLGPALHLLIVENVGNLVCPTAFDVGEDEKVAVLSVTEGEDKPLKYPALFHAASVCLVTKVDLLPHLDFDVEKLYTNLKAINPDIKIFPLSAKTGEGMEAWLDSLKARAKGMKP